MWPKHLCISDNLLVAPRIYLQRYPESLRQSSKSVEICCIYLHVLHSGLIHGFSGAFPTLEVISPNESGPYVSYCTISFQLLISSQLGVCYDRVLWQKFPCLPNNWPTPTLRSSTPALTGARFFLLVCMFPTNSNSLPVWWHQSHPTNCYWSTNFRQWESLYCQKQQTNI